MSFLGIPSFEDIGKYIEAEHIKPPKEWQDMVASFPSELRERYYSTLGSEGAKSGINIALGRMDKKEAVVHYFSDERILAEDILSHVMQQKIGLSKETAQVLSTALIGTQDQFAETLSMAMDGKYEELVKQSVFRMVKEAELGEKAQTARTHLKNNKPQELISVEGAQWLKRYGNASIVTFFNGYKSQGLEQAVKEISQNKPEIIMDMISDEISKKMPSLNAQENKLLSNVLFMAATSENPKDFGEKMSKLMKQGHNLKMMQDIAQKQFGISIGDLSKVTPTQWEHHADWVMKAAGARDFAQLRRHAILKPETIMASFVGEIEKNPELIAKVAKQIAPHILASVDTKFLSGLFGTITSSKTAEECVKRMETFLSQPENMTQMNKLLEGAAGKNAEYLKELTPKDWMGTVSSIVEKYGSFDNLKGATILRHNEVLKDFVSKIETTVIQKKTEKAFEEGAEYLQSGLKKMGAFFGGSSR